MRASVAVPLYPEPLRRNCGESSISRPLDFYHVGVRPAPVSIWRPGIDTGQEAQPVMSSCTARFQDGRT